MSELTPISGSISRINTQTLVHSGADCIAWLNGLNLANSLNPSRPPTNNYLAATWEYRDYGAGTGNAQTFIVNVSVLSFDTSGIETLPTSATVEFSASADLPGVTDINNTDIVLSKAVVGDYTNVVTGDWDTLMDNAGTIYTTSASMDTGESYGGLRTTLTFNDTGLAAMRDEDVLTVALYGTGEYVTSETVRTYGGIPRFNDGTCSGGEETCCPTSWAGYMGGMVYATGSGLEPKITYSVPFVQTLPRIGLKSGRMDITAGSVSIK